MHGYRCFPGTGHALYDHIVVGRFTDDVVLLLLDGRYDFSQHRLLVLCQVFSQELVIGNHLGIVIIQKLSVFNFIGSLHLQVDFYALACIMPAVRRRITALSQPVFIVGIRHRRPPVHYHPVGGILRYPAAADVEGFGLVKRLVTKNDSAEIWFLHGLFISCQRPLHVIMQCNRIIQDRVNLCIVIVVMLQHFIDVGLHACHFPAVVFHIVVNHCQRSGKIRFLFPL